MRCDERGLAVTNASDQVIEGINQFTDDFMSARDRAGIVIDLADQHPECALLQAYAAALYLYSQSGELIHCKARPYLDRAHSLFDLASEREQLLIGALEAWAVTDPRQAILLLENLVHSWPGDIVAAKIAEFLFYEAPDYPRHLSFMNSIAAANAGSPAFGAMHSFALELNGRYAEAETVARQALETESDTPWAQHTLGHLFLNQGRIDEGLREFESFAPTWSRHSWPTCCHNTWHLALLYLGKLDVGKALAICRDRMRGANPDDVFELVDVISLLWRLELVGQPIQDDWTAIASLASPRALEQVFPFLNAHFLYALARGGMETEAQNALTELRAFSDRQSCVSRQVWHDVGLPLARGILAFARGDYLATVRELGPVSEKLPMVGGSDAQNDLFIQTYLVGLARSGQTGAAQELFRQRTRGRQPIPAELALLATP